MHRSLCRARLFDLALYIVFCHVGAVCGAGWGSFRVVGFAHFRRARVLSRARIGGRQPSAIDRFQAEIPPGNNNKETVASECGGGLRKGASMR
jgi:hypothetical protein